MRPFRGLVSTCLLFAARACYTPSIGCQYLGHAGSGHRDLPTASLCQSACEFAESCDWFTFVPTRAKACLLCSTPESLNLEGECSTGGVATGACVGGPETCPGSPDELNPAELLANATAAAASFCARPPDGFEWSSPGTNNAGDLANADETELFERGRRAGIPPGPKDRGFGTVGRGRTPADLDERSSGRSRGPIERTPRGFGPSQGPPSSPAAQTIRSTRGDAARRVASTWPPQNRATIQSLGPSE